MPFLFEYKCDADECAFSISIWEGGALYVTDETGKRIICQHPGESHTIARVLKIPEEKVMGFPYFRSDPDMQPLLKERMGVLTNCVCLDCSHSLSLDTDKDPKKCSKCKSTHIVPVKEMDGVACPKCHEGIIHCHDSGIIS